MTPLTSGRGPAAPGEDAGSGRVAPGARVGAVVAFLAMTVGGCAPAASAPPAPAPTDDAGLEIRLYVANESSDIVSRVVFSAADGARVEREIPVGMMPADTDAPHGIAVSPDGEHWYVTLAHGTPYGHLWKFHAGADTLVSRTTLGRFPASLGTSPDGAFVFVVNFNLHGDMEPSDLSIVYAPTLTEIARIESCLMPHGSRSNAAGTRHYHVCMHSDQLVALEVPAFRIAHRYSLAPGREGLLDVDDAGAAHHAPGHAPPAPAGAPQPEERTCGPTWVAPGGGDAAGRVVYVACNRADEVVEVDVGTWEVTRRFPMGRAPYNLAVSADGTVLVTTLRGDQAISVVDLVTGEERARLETSRPITHGVVLSPDGRYAFVTNESVGSVRGTLDVFDLTRLERATTLELHHQPGGIDLWRVDAPGTVSPPADR